MSKLPIISGKKAIGAFVKIGYWVISQKGSHIRLHHPVKKPLTVPNHKTLGKGLLKKLLRDSEVSVEEFVKLFK